MQRCLRRCLRKMIMLVVLSRSSAAAGKIRTSQHLSLLAGVTCTFAFATLLTLMSCIDTTFWSTTTCTDLDPDTIRFSHSKIYDRFSCGRYVHMCVYEFGGSDYCWQPDAEWYCIDARSSRHLRQTLADIESGLLKVEQLPSISVVDTGKSHDNSSDLSNYLPMLSPSRHAGYCDATGCREIVSLNNRSVAYTKLSVRITCNTGSVNWVWFERMQTQINHIGGYGFWSSANVLAYSGLSLRVY